MSVAAFFTTRASVSVSSVSIPTASRSSITLCSTRSSTSSATSSSQRRQQNGIRRLSTSATSSAPNVTAATAAATSQQQNFKYTSSSSNSNSSSTAGMSTDFTKRVLLGLSAAGLGLGTIGVSAFDGDGSTIGISSSNNRSVSLCDPQSSTTSSPQTLYDNLGDQLKTLKKNIKIVPTIAIGSNNANSNTNANANTTTSIPERMIDAVKAASEWEKKAKETAARIMTRPPYPEMYDVSVRALKGDRLSMEDRYSINNDGRFAAVFDGHGGGCVSTYLSETLFNKINKRLKDKEVDKKERNSLAYLTETIRASFQEVDEEVLQNDEYQYQGSTAVATWLHEDADEGRRTLVSANVGDSRAVLSHKRRAVDLTKDHKPDDAEERKRILAMGEKIEWDSYCNVHRVRNLSLSRAIGDKFAKPAVCSEVDIRSFPLEDTEGDDFVVLASDGLWDVMTSQGCVDYINNRLNPSDEQMKSMSTVEAQRQKFTKRKNMSRFVANEALRRGSYDNVCVIIVWLNKPDNAKH